MHKTKATIGFVLGLLLQSAGAPAHADPATDTVLEEYSNRFGGDFRDFDLGRPDPLECLAACAADTRCRAFTYVKPFGWRGATATAHCSLTEAIPEAHPDPCCISCVVRPKVTSGAPAAATPDAAAPVRLHFVSGARRGVDAVDVDLYRVSAGSASSDRGLVDSIAFRDPMHTANSEFIYDEPTDPVKSAAELDTVTGRFGKTWFGHVISISAMTQELHLANRFIKLPGVAFVRFAQGTPGNWIVEETRYAGKGIPPSSIVITWFGHVLGSNDPSRPSAAMGSTGSAAAVAKLNAAVRTLDLTGWQARRAKFGAEPCCDKPMTVLRINIRGADGLWHEYLTAVNTELLSADIAAVHQAIGSF